MVAKKGARGRKDMFLERKGSSFANDLADEKYRLGDMITLTRLYSFHRSYQNSSMVAPRRLLAAECRGTPIHGLRRRQDLGGEEIWCQLLLRSMSP